MQGCTVLMSVCMSAFLSQLTTEKRKAYGSWNVLDKSKVFHIRCWKGKCGGNCEMMGWRHDLNYFSFWFAESDGKNRRYENSWTKMCGRIWCLLWFWWNWFKLQVQTDMFRCQGLVATYTRLFTCHHAFELNTFAWTISFFTISQNVDTAGMSWGCISFCTTVFLFISLSVPQDW